MSPTKLVIVESPTKAKTIEKFLGKEFLVKASYGHVRDLPNNASEIPETIKKERWARLGINVENNFEPLYVIPKVKSKQLNELKKDLAKAEELLLATDEDREGESISWHLLEVLKPKIPHKRLVFHEITKDAIKDALKKARDIDLNLVQAQETRRVVDRLFGYSISPLLWKKMAPRLSAGRVQSVALRLLVDRELERIKFRSSNYWDLAGEFFKDSPERSFSATLVELDGEKIAIGKDFDPLTGTLLPNSSARWLKAAEAEATKESLSKETPRITLVEEKPFTQKPSPPFVTSTLQQEASAKLGFAARRTMQVAQSLYENGFITYMRTDSTTLSEEAIGAARSYILSEYGKDYLPSEPRIYKTKVRNAQEAHEAIRPAGSQFASFESVREKLGGDALKLYELIWKRTVASQMNDASGKRVGVNIALGKAIFRATGKTISFPGFLRAYVEGSDDPDSDLADKERILPPLKEGDQINLLKLTALSHDTQPPARFTEGTLIKELEKLGIGRPSTWATIVDLVLSRDYAFKRGQALIPTFLAIAIVELLRKFFTQLLDFEFTARLEDDLDAISRGEAERLQYLNNFYYGNGHAGLIKLVENGEEKIDPREVCGITIGEIDGRNVEVRIGKFGPFLSDGENRASLPENTAPDELTLEKATALLTSAAQGPASLGIDPKSGLSVYLKKGRFGPYIQLGEMPAKEESTRKKRSKKDRATEKPKMASLLPGMEERSVTLEVALKLLELPKSLGINPENNQEIILFNGRFGPYLRCGDETRTISEGIDVLSIDLSSALEILKQPKVRRRANTTKQSAKEIGTKPDSTTKILLKSGRFGPYVTDGKLNASIPKSIDPENISLDEAISLLEARAQKLAEA
ncbi:MAG TPA: type I DNA topoisomerase [Oligoflexia bacterium]|nr:type I DNA topoisomerase [Oligoflexia bacterium]HMP26890.1 type I DNA topoisomerase [Oligoflexia bacterium]